MKVRCNGIRLNVIFISHLQTYQEPDEDELKYDVHFWIGKYSTQVNKNHYINSSALIFLYILFSFRNFTKSTFIGIVLIYF